MSERDSYYAEYYDHPEKQKEALRQALSNRQFEIDYYWKRTAYFWTLTAAALTGYFALASPKNPVHAGQFASFAVGCLGLLISTSWFFVNKGSKFWHENWENHVAALSPPETGSLFRKVLRRPDEGVTRFFNVTRPAPISVSKINQWVSLYVIGFWIGLLAMASPLATKPASQFLGAHRFALTFGATVLFIVAMRIWSCTSMGPHRPVVRYIPSDITN